MPIAIIKNLSFRTSLYLTAEVSRTKEEGADKWYVEVTLAMPSDKAPYSRKRVPFRNSEDAVAALQQLVSQLNDLEPSEDDEEEDDDDEGDEYEGDDDEDV